MITLELNLPTELAQRARHAGLLNDDAIQRLLNAALLKQAKRREAGQRLLEIATRLHDDGSAPMSEEALADEISAYRKAKRTAAACA